MKYPRDKSGIGLTMVLSTGFFMVGCTLLSLSIYASFSDIGALVGIPFGLIACLVSVGVVRTQIQRTRDVNITKSGIAIGALGNESEILNWSEIQTIEKISRDYALAAGWRPGLEIKIVGKSKNIKISDNITNIQQFLNELNSYAQIHKINLLFREKRFAITSKLSTTRKERRRLQIEGITNPIDHL